MKKRKLFLLIIVALISVCTFSPVNASEYYSPDTKVETVYLPHGVYIVSTIQEGTSYASPYSTEQTKSGSKTSTVYSATGKSLYSITVYGTFSYNGSSATAKSSSYSYTDESSLWSFSYGSSSYSGSTATATGTFKSAVTSKSLSASLTCSASGTLS